MVNTQEAYEFVERTLAEQGCYAKYEDGGTRLIDAMAVLRHAQAETVMMVGHNPGIAEFAERIVAQAPAHSAYQRYPTGATLVASFEIDAWQDVTFGSGAVRDFVVPRELAV